MLRWESVQVHAAHGVDGEPKSSLGSREGRLPRVRLRDTMSMIRVDGDWRQRDR